MLVLYVVLFGQLGDVRSVSPGGKGCFELIRLFRGFAAWSIVDEALQWGDDLPSPREFSSIQAEKKGDKDFEKYSWGWGKRSLHEKGELRSDLASAKLHCG